MLRRLPSQHPRLCTAPLHLPSLRQRLFARQRKSAPPFSQARPLPLRHRQAESRSDFHDTLSIMSVATTSAQVGDAAASGLAPSPVVLAAPRAIRFISAAEASEIDHALMSADQHGYALEQLMELAGLACAQTVFRSYPPDTFPVILVGVGPGNQGGDGLVAARHLQQFGYNVLVWAPKLKGDHILVSVQSRLPAYYPRSKQPHAAFHPCFPSDVQCPHVLILLVSGWSGNYATWTSSLRWAMIRASRMRWIRRMLSWIPFLVRAWPKPFCIELRS